MEDYITNSVNNAFGNVSIKSSNKTNPFFKLDPTNQCKIIWALAKIKKIKMSVAPSNFPFITYSWEDDFCLFIW